MIEVKLQGCIEYIGKGYYELIAKQKRITMR